jgi:hypothetical protein
MIYQNQIWVIIVNKKIKILPFISKKKNKNSKKK